MSNATTNPAITCTSNAACACNACWFDNCLNDTLPEPAPRPVDKAICAQPDRTPFERRIQAAQDTAYADLRCLQLYNER